MLLRTPQGRHRGAPRPTARRVIAAVGAAGLLMTSLSLAPSASADGPGDPFAPTTESYEITHGDALTVQLAFGEWQDGYDIGDGPRILADSLTATDVTATHPATGDTATLPAPSVTLVSDGTVEDGGGYLVRGQAVASLALDAAGYEGWELATTVGFEVEHPDGTVTSHTHEATLREFVWYTVPTNGTQFYEGGPSSVRIEGDALPDTLAADVATAEARGGCENTSPVGTVSHDGGGWTYEWTEWPDPEFREFGYAACDQITVVHRDGAGRQVGMGTTTFNYVPPADLALTDDGHYEVKVGEAVRIPGFANDGLRPYPGYGSGLVDPVGGGSPAGPGADESESPEPRLTRITGLDHGTVEGLSPSNRRIYLDDDGAVTGAALFANAHVDDDIVYRGLTPGTDTVTQEVCSHYLPTPRCSTASFTVTVTDPATPPPPPPATCATDPARCPAPEPEPEPVVGPTARDDRANARVGTPHRVRVLANDDWSGDAEVTLLQRTIPGGMKARVLDDGVVEVTVQPGRWQGKPVTLGYRLTDSTGRSDTATIVVVTPPRFTVGADRDLAAAAAAASSGPVEPWMLGTGLAALLTTGGGVALVRARHRSGV